MLIMSLAHAQASGDGSLLAQHVRNIPDAVSFGCLTTFDAVWSLEQMGKLSGQQHDEHRR